MHQDGPKVQMNLPTPWIGVTEQIMLGVVLLWVEVLSVALLRDKRYTGLDGQQ